MVTAPYRGAQSTGDAGQPTPTPTPRRMKRSRAYDDLVALAEEAETHRNDACCALLSGWSPFVAPGARLHRFKRSRGDMEDGDAARHALQFSLEMTDPDFPAAPRSDCSSASSSSASLSSIAADDDDDVLPLRRNSREHIMLLQQQKKQQQQRLHEISSDEDAPGLQLSAGEAVMGAPETPEARVLRAGYAREALCIDPLDKCQVPPPQFGMSAFLVLAVSPKR